MNGERYTLSGLAVPEGLASLHDLLARASRDHQSLPPEDVMMFEMAVMEIAGNVIKHGKPPGAVVWNFTLDVGPPLHATLADSGEEYVETWTGQMPDELAESGRGLALADAVLDHLIYERQGAINVWTMVRSVDTKSEPVHDTINPGRLPDGMPENSG